MKHIHILILACFLITGACGSAAEVVQTAASGSSATASESPTPNATPATPLGILSLEENQVFHGTDENALVPLLESASFFEKEMIQVIEGGEAVLDFGDQMRLRLFNDSELQMVAAQIADDVPLGVQVFLFVGGFTGQLTREGGRAVFRTPGNVEITVLGTEYFVVYDPQTMETTVGNFGGSVQVSSAGSQVTLEDGSYLVVPADSPPGTPLPLALSREEFENLAREADSPLQAANQVKSWSLEIRHEFVFDYYDPAGSQTLSWTPASTSYLRSWSGQFRVDGDQIVGSGTGLIKDEYLRCVTVTDQPSTKNPGWPEVLSIEFNLEGSFDFDIGGQLVSGEGGRPAFRLEITAKNLKTSSLDDLLVLPAGWTSNCDFFGPFFLDINTSIIEDLPLLDADAIILDVVPGAKAVFLLDPKPYTKYEVGKAPWTYKDIHFKYPLEVTINQGP